MKPRILIVDDDPDVLEWLERLLATTFEVACAESGAQALELLAAGDYVALVTDDSMPGMRGTELCAKARVAHPELACLLVSGYGERSFDPGVADRVLTKPVDSSELRHAISAAIVAKAKVRR